MNQEFTILIEKLATQLGQTAESMWHILIEQAKIAAITNYVCGGLFIIAALIFLINGIIEQRKANKGKDDKVICGELFASMIASPALILASFVFLLPAITATFNPEYWALQKLINMI